MGSKPQVISGYSCGQTELAERVLLDVWSRLGVFHSHLVLVGGLAPRYLVPQAECEGKGISRHCGTMDVDLAVSLAVADLRTYASIRKTLIGSLGFQPGQNRLGNEQRHSFRKEVGDAVVILDFLTTAYDGPVERVRAVEDSLSAIQVEGLGLALRAPLEIAVQGELLEDGWVETELRVCRLIPFVVLKALALKQRGERKDAYDLVYVIRYAAGGPAGVAGQLEEEERRSDAFQHAKEVLREKFQSPAHDGPVKCQRFQGATGPEEANQAFAAVQEFLGALR